MGLINSSKSAKNKSNVRIKGDGGQKVKKVILAVAIAIIFVLFVGFGISVFYKDPQYNNFCKDNYNLVANNSTECTNRGGKWNSYEPVQVVKGVATAPEKMAAVNVPPTYTCIEDTTKVVVPGTDNAQVTLTCTKNLNKEDIPNGYCDFYYYCQQDFNKAQEAYNKIIFIVTLVIGIIIILISVVLLRIASVSSGLMAGGVMTIIYGVIRYWQYSNDVLRFSIFGVVLLILIWIGYKKLNK